MNYAENPMNNISRGECKINELNEKVDLSSDGYLTLRSKNTNDLPSDIRFELFNFLSSISQ